MKKKLSILLTLVLVLTLSLVTAVPATAADPVGLSLITVGVDSTAEWVDAETMSPQAPYAGAYSLKLYALKGTGEGGGAAGVYIPVNVAIEDIDSLSFARLGTTDDKDAKVNLLIDADNDGDLDFTEIDALTHHLLGPTEPPPGGNLEIFGEDAMLFLNPTLLIADDVWATVDVYSTYKYWGRDKTGSLNWEKNAGLGDVGGVQDVGEGVIDPTDKVLGVIVLLGAGSGVADQTVYIDDIEVDGTLYPLEWTPVSPIQVDDDRVQFPDAPFQTIQGAVDCAVAGDTIIVAEGTYTENPLVNKEVALIGEPGANIKGYVQISANGVTVDGFSITDFGLIFGQWWGIYIESGTGITVSNNVIDGAARWTTPSTKVLGIETHSGSGASASIEGNTIKNVRLGISVNAGNNLTITGGNTIEDTVKGIIIGASPVTTTITGNTIRNNQQIGIEVYSAENVAIHYNNISGNTLYGVQHIGSLPVVDATYNWWGSINGPTHAGNTFNVGDQGDAVSDNALYVPWLDAASPDGTSFAPVKNVTDEPDSLFSSIQAAIDAGTTDPSDTINVAAGTYAENVVVDETLTLQGENRGTTEIKFGYDINDWRAKPPLTIFANDVIVSGFTISSGPYIEPAWTIVVEGDSALLNDLNVKKEPLLDGDNGQPRIGGSAFWLAPGLDGFTLTDSIVESEWNGISAEQESKDITVRNVDFTYPGEWAIILKMVTGATIEENTFTCTGHSMANKDSQGIVISRGSTEIEIRKNQFIGSSQPVFARSHIGILLQAWKIGPVGVSILGNDISDFDRGIKVEADVETSGIQINYNSITGDTYSVENLASTMLDATKNWWGGVAGPQHSTNPYNDEAIAAENSAVSAFVDYLPWMIQSDLAEDWNIWSRPIAPDEDSWAQMKAELVEDGIEAIYYYDSTNEQWGVDPDEANLLDAFYIKMPAESRIRYCFSAEATWPSQKDMKVGWNLVGLAELYEMPVDEALSDAYYGTGVAANLCGYNKVISPSLNGILWTYMLGQRSPPNMVPTKGYWVFMVNDGVLGGFSTTPIVELED